MKHHKFVIVSYFTIGTGYEKEAKKLGDSLGELDISFFLMPIRNQGNWDKNTHYKATFIREMLDCFPDKKIVFVDADAIVHKYPILFDKLNCDIAYHRRTGRRNYPEGEVLSGTLLFGNTAKAKELIDNWIAFNKSNPGIWEQRNLKRALLSTDKVISVELPIEYCTIFDDPQRNQIDPVIEHFQRSRQYKREVMKE